MIVQASQVRECQGTDILNIWAMQQLAVLHPNPN